MADGKIIIDTKIDASGAEKGVKGLGNRLGSMAKGGLNLFTKGIGAASVVLGGLGAYALKVGSDFEEGMSKVKAVSGATGEEMELLAAKAKEMGAKTKFSATESAEAMLYMGMAGWKSQQMIDGLPGIMNLAAASGEELGLVSDIVTDALTAFGLKAKDSARFADLLASASSNSNTNVSMLGESFKYVAPVAGALGHSAQDTAFALGLMANAGIKGSQSGTALRASLTNLAKPTKAMGKSMDALGISLVDSNGEVKEGKKLYDELREKFAPLTDAQKASTAATLFGKEAMSGMLAVINASDEDYNNLYDNLTNSAGAAENMANIMNDNLKGQVVLLKSALEGLGIQLYESVDNPLKDIVKSANGMIETLSKAFKKGGFAALTESIGTILAQIITGIATYAPKIIDSALVVIQAFIKGIQNNLPQIVKSSVKIIKSLVNGVIALLPKILQLGMQLILELGKGIADNTSKMMPAIVNVIVAICDMLIKDMPKIIEIGMKIIKALTQGLIDSLPQIIMAAIQIINGLVMGLMQMLPQILQMGIDIIVQLALGLAQMLPTLIPVAIDCILTLVDTLLDNIDAIIDAGIALIIALAEGLIKAIPQLIEKTPIIIEKLLNALMDNWPKLLKAGIDLVIMIAEGLIQAIPKLLSKIPILITSMLGAIGKFFKKFYETGSIVVQKIGDGLISMLGFAIKNCGTLAKTILDSIKSGIVGVFDIGVNIVKGVWNGIASLAGWLGSKVTGFFKGIVDGAKRILGIHSPSRVFRDQVGTMMAQGVGVGFEDETENIQDSMSKNLSDLTAKMQATVDYEVVNTNNDIVAKNNQGTSADVTTLADTKDGDVFIVKNYIDSDELSEYTYKKVDGKFALAGKRVR